MRSNKKFQKSFWGETYNGLLTRRIHFYFQILFNQKSSLVIRVYSKVVFNLILKYNPSLPSIARKKEFVTRISVHLIFSLKFVHVIIGVF